MTKTSVTNAARLLKEGGFRTMDEGKRIRLTEPGLEMAGSICDRHGIFTKGLLYLGVDAWAAEPDTGRIDQDISRRGVEKRKKVWVRHLNEKAGRGSRI